MPIDSEIFGATADNFLDTMNCHNANVGFRVPEYQRTYDWNEENIKRLLEDCLNGFYYLSETNTKESYTFLGTIILVRESAEVSFDGNSLSVVDGQQRLTSLILLCCALIEELIIQQEDINHLPESILGWIKREIDFIIGRLYTCAFGKLFYLDQSSPFPRIVRSLQDTRAFDSSNAEYSSDIASFLMDFNTRYSHAIKTSTFLEIENNLEGKYVFQNYEYIKKQVNLGIYKGEVSSDTEDCELEHEQVIHKDFQKSGLRNLFEKLDTVSDEQHEKDRAISDIANTQDSSGLVRIILFSHYVLKSVVLTRVETGNEDAAFDIFDSLNTTGMPLTAIETFKPRVINFEKNEGYVNFSRTESAKEFRRIEDNLNEIYNDTEKRQSESKELVVSFALYLEGQKLSLNLASQRNYLRRTFERAQTPELKRNFTRSLADITEFRQNYWNSESIKRLDRLHNINVSSNWLKLCCTFISEMKTSLAVPIMARYWKQYQQDQSEDTFIHAVKALTTFLVLRRSVTSSTAGLDSDFRKLMNKLCIGLDYSNPILRLDELKTEFKKYLASPRIGIKNKESWVSQVYEVPLAGRLKPLCRFLLFAASHNSRSDEEKPGLLKREGIVPGDELIFLSFSRWQDEKYATVEHIAPESNSGGWDKEIYSRLQTRNLIGNIILLPQKENSSVGNSSWSKKILFYRALAAKTEKDRNNQFIEAEKIGFTFKKETKDLLKKQGRLHMLDPIANVTEWTKKVIYDRSRNILELAWEEIAPWLDYKD